MKENKIKNSSETTKPQPSNRRLGLAPRHKALVELHHFFAKASWTGYMRSKDGHSNKEFTRVVKLDDPRDEALAQAMFLEVIRRLGDIDSLIISQLKSPEQVLPSTIVHILRLLTAQILIMKLPPHAAGQTAVELVRKMGWAGFAPLVNAIARKFDRNIDDYVERLAKDKSTRNHPRWLKNRWQKHYSADQVKNFIHSYKTPPPIDLTFPEKNKYITEIYEQHQGQWLGQNGLRLPFGHEKVDQLPGYEEGAFWVQDFAATLPAKLLKLKKGQSVLDLCAAPGGKTMQLSSMGYQVIAIDKNPERMKRVAENLKRTKLQAKLCSINLFTHKDMAHFKSNKSVGILLDAPCSSTGTLRRHPDIRLLRQEEDINSLMQLQAQLLNKSLAWLKPDGVLIYSVCSLEPEEGELQIKSFLANNKSVIRDPITIDEVKDYGACLTGDGDVRLTPDMLQEIGGMDGFFISRLRKRL